MSMLTMKWVIADPNDPKKGSTIEIKKQDLINMDVEELEDKYKIPEIKKDD